MLPEHFDVPELSDAGGGEEGVEILRPVTYARAEAPGGMRAAAEELERKFKIEFESLYFFSDSLLRKLHRIDGDIADLPPEIEVTSGKDPTIIQDIQVLTDIVNNAPGDPAQRARYFETLKAIYRKLHSSPEEFTQDRSMLFIGVEREGRILARHLEWLPAGHHTSPHAKRMRYDGGLLVGVTKMENLEAYFKCLVIDGAIASGATIISIIEKVRPLISSYRVYSVHGTYEGLHALSRYCNSTGLDVKVTVGHATRGLNSKFYAVDTPHTKLLVVGDLGDTISDL